jgi:hypothetical protein
MAPSEDIPAEIAAGLCEKLHCCIIKLMATRSNIDGNNL